MLLSSKLQFSLILNKLKPMKTFLIIIFSILSQQFFSQCQILGSETAKVGDSLKFRSDIVAKCTDCYHWNVSPENKLRIQTSGEGQISVKFLETGLSTVLLSVETEQGTKNCKRSIEIQNPPSQKEKPCNVAITDFKDVKVDENTMSFFPNVISQIYTYQWKANFADGSIQESTEKIPQFTNNKYKVIESVEVKIHDKTTLCSHIINRTFGYNYWFPKVEKIEQRKYIQEAYLQSQTKQ